MFCKAVSGLTNKRKEKWLPLLLCGLFFLCRLAARGVSLAYSSAGTDVLYMEGQLPDILLTIRAVLLWASVVCTVFSFSALAGSVSQKILKGMAWGFSLIVFADAAAMFLIDVCTGAVGVFVWMALIMDTATFLFEAVFVWLVYWIARRSATAKKSILRASALHMAGRLAMETVYLIQFLIEVDFAPYANEVWTILLTYLGIVLWQGAAVWLASMLLYRWCKRGSRRSA